MNSESFHRLSLSASQYSVVESVPKTKPTSSKWRGVVALGHGRTARYAIDGEGGIVDFLLSDMAEEQQ